MEDRPPQITPEQLKAERDEAYKLGDYWGRRMALTRVRNASRHGENVELIRELYEDCIELRKTITPTPPAPPPLYDLPIPGALSLGRR